MAPCLSLTCVLEKDEAAIERSQFNATSVADVDKRVKRRLLMGNTFLPLPLLYLHLCPCACACVRAAVWGRECVLACGVCVRGGGGPPACARACRVRAGGRRGLHSRCELAFPLLKVLPFTKHVYFSVCL